MHVRSKCPVHIGRSVPLSLKSIDIQFECVVAIKESRWATLAHNFTGIVWIAYYSAYYEPKKYHHHLSPLLIKNISLDSDMAVFGHSSSKPLDNNRLGDDRFQIDPDNVY